MSKTNCKVDVFLSAHVHEDGTTNEMRTEYVNNILSDYYPELKDKARQQQQQTDCDYVVDYQSLYAEMLGDDDLLTALMNHAALNYEYQMCLGDKAMKDVMFMLSQEHYKNAIELMVALVNMRERDAVLKLSDAINSNTSNLESGAGKFDDETDTENEPINDEMYYQGGAVWH